MIEMNKKKVPKERVHAIVKNFRSLEDEGIDCGLALKAALRKTRDDHAKRSNKNNDSGGSHDDAAKKDEAFVSFAKEAYDMIGLPHQHYYDRKTVSQTIDNFDRQLAAVLERSAKPSMVTIARSTEDGFCPKEMVEFIQARVLDCVKHRVDSRADIFFDFQQEDTNTEDTNAT